MAGDVQAPEKPEMPVSGGLRAGRRRSSGRASSTAVAGRRDLPETVQRAGGRVNVVGAREEAAGTTPRFRGHPRWLPPVLPRGPHSARTAVWDSALQRPGSPAPTPPTRRPPAVCSYRELGTWPVRRRAEQRIPWTVRLQCNSHPWLVAITLDSPGPDSRFAALRGAVSGGRGCLLRWTVILGTRRSSRQLRAPTPRCALGEPRPRRVSCPGNAPGLHS